MVQIPGEVVVAAVSRNGVIGADGTIPWSSPDEMALFRKITMGGTLIMGRRTWLSIGHPLPGRRIIVISSTLASAEGVVVLPSFEQAVTVARKLSAPIFYCGGVSVYREALRRADEIALSRMEIEVDGDTLFPPIDPLVWEEVSRQPFAGFTHYRYMRRG